MPIIVKLQDIDEAVENLHYKSETTLKFKLLRALRHYYADETAAESLQSIDTEELVRTIWETGDDRDLLKTKRKNFSSLKSSVNSDLKKLYAEGKNPQGIVIGHNNIFSISDEAKDKALAGIMDVFRDKGIDTQSKISEILSALNDILSASITETDAENTKEEIDRLKTILSGLSGKLGFSLQDIIRRAEQTGSESPPAAREVPEKDPNLAGDIRGGLSMIDRGIQELAREIEEAGGTQKALVESVHRAVDDIVRVLRDSKTDPSGKAREMIVSVSKILTETIEAREGDLPGDSADRLKQIIQEMTETADGTPTGGQTEAADETAQGTAAGGKLQTAFSHILEDAGLSPTEKVGKIMAAVENAIGEALTGEGTGLSEADIAGIKSAMARITNHLGALVEEELAGIDDAQKDREEPLRHAVTDILQTLRDSETDAAKKAQIILSALQSVLDEAIDNAGAELPGNQADTLKQIFSEWTKAAALAAPGEDETRGENPQASSSTKGNSWLAAVSAILEDEGISETGKVGKILAAVSDLLDQTLEEGHGNEDLSRIREVLRSVTGGLGALAELEVVEEVVGEGAEESAASIETVESLKAPLEEIPDAEAGWQSLESETEEVTSSSAETLEVVEEVIVEDAGTATTSAEVFEEGEIAPEGIAEEFIEDVPASASTPETGRETGNAQELMSVALADLAGAVRDSETDAAGGTQKILDAVEEVLDAALAGAAGGLSAEQADSIREILHGMIQSPDGPLNAAVSGILGIEDLSASGKIGQMLDALGEAINEAVEEAASGLSEGDRARIREVLCSIAGDIEAHGIEALAGLEIVEEVVGEDSGESKPESNEEFIEDIPAEVETSEPVRQTGDAQELMSAALADLAGAVRDSETDTAGGTQKILDAVEEVLDAALAGAAGGLSAEQADSIREILHGMIQSPDGPLNAAVSGILGIEDLSASGKIGQMLDALGEAINEAVEEAASGLSEGDRARIREVLCSIAGDIEAHGIEALAGLEIVEEVVGEGAEESAASIESATSALEEIPDAEAGWQNLEAETEDATSSAGETLEVVEEVIVEDSGIAATSAEVFEEGEIAPEGIAEEFIEDIPASASTPETGRETGNAQELMSVALADLAGAVRDSETDAAVGAQKILDAVEEVLDAALAGAADGLSPEQTDSLREILHGMVQAQDGPLNVAVSGILGNEGLSAGDKIGKMLDALSDAVNEAVEEAGSGLSEEDRARIREVLSSIAGDIEAHGIEALAGLEIVEEVVEDDSGELPGSVDAMEGVNVGGEQQAALPGGTGGAADLNADAEESPVLAEAGIGESLRRGFAAVAEILRDAQTDATGKAAKILDAVEEIIGDAIGTEESGFSGGEAEELKQILRGIVRGLPEGGGAADQAGGRLTAAIAGILGNSDLSAGGKIGGILTAINDLITEELAGGLAGLSDEEQERIRGMMANLTGNLDLLGRESLAGLEIVEDDAGQGGADVADEKASGGPGESPVGAKQDRDPPGIRVSTADGNVDEDLREKTDLLSRLAEAAGTLSGLGPDLGGSVYTEEELRGKAKFLSEEFDRYLSVRDKFYNAHVLIRGGDYRVGGAHLAKSVLEEQVVTLADFYIGKFPVTNALFEIFVEQTGYVTTAEKYGYGLVYFPRMQRSRDPITGVERFSLHSQAYSKKVPGACWHRPSGPDSSLYLKRAPPGGPGEHGGRPGIFRLDRQAASDRDGMGSGRPDGA